MIATTEVFRRKLVPAELRHVELEPARREEANLGFSAAVTTGMTTFGVGAFLQLPALACASPVVAIVAYALGHMLSARRTTGEIPTEMVVTPWGIVAGSPIPWSAIEGITHSTLVQQSRRSQRGEEEIGLSRLAVRAKGSILAGQRVYESMLEVLDVVLVQYAGEGSCAVALDLNPDGPTVPTAHPGAAADVLSAARALLQSDAGEELVDVSADGYRARRTVVRLGTEGRLDRLLVEAPSGRDAGPLAAALAAELGIVGLVDRLCELVTAPNPILAAVAKAAALRLGAHPSRAGKLDELHPFLDAGDIAALEAWASERREPPPET